MHLKILKIIEIGLFSLEHMIKVGKINIHEKHNFYHPHLPKTSYLKYHKVSVGDLGPEMRDEWTHR